MTTLTNTLAILTHLGAHGIGLLILGLVGLGLVLDGVLGGAR